MTKAFLNIAIIGACAMLAAAARGQDDPQSPLRQNSKHMSATGQESEPCVRASKLVGAQVNDRSGNRLGEIEDVILNPRAGRIDFALLSLNGTPASNANPAANANGNLVPVPWSLLKSPAGAAEYSASTEQPVFTLNADEKKLEKAPKVDWTHESEWRQRIYAYYGVTPPPMGGAETEQGQMKGQGARSLQSNGPGSSPSPPLPGP